jgi:hypothetical protein
MVAYASKTLPLATQTRCAAGQATGATMAPPAGHFAAFAR